MTGGFYVKTAWNHLKKNYRFYIPQMLTGSGLLASFYIVLTIATDGRLKEVKGGDYLPTFMAVGTAVMAVLSVILVFYTNSFLMKQRKREYGIFHVLGMEKRHIGRVLFFETLISGGCAILLGLCFGVLLYKLCSLLICRLFQTDIVMGFYFITPKTLVPSGLFFLFLYALSYLFNRIEIARMKPVELLSSRSVGEKEPKTKRFLLIFGILTLGGGYALAVLVKNPIEALILFFVAVFLVIIGTYCLFTAGSIFVLKLLKKNKNYYYQKRHFSSVSGLLYRMKQNAVGLASICILATGVLVMVSSTVSLYAGMEDTIKTNYPHQCFFSAGIYDSEDGAEPPLPEDVLKRITEESAEKAGLEISFSEMQKYLSVFYLLDGNVFYSKNEVGEHYDYSKLTSLFMITADTYSHLTGKTLSLGKNQIAVCRIASEVKHIAQKGNSVVLHGTEYEIATVLDSFPVSENLNLTSSAYGFVVENEEELNRILEAHQIAYGDYASTYTSRVALDFSEEGFTEEKYDAFFDEVVESLETEFPGCSYFFVCDDVWGAEESMIGMYGTFLFLGIILGTVCLFATALIIYYKQISEGYEDRKRYQIMKKVGMSDGEIKATIRTQTLLVFFLPLIAAGVHICFAFPMINRLLHVMLLSSTALFAWVSAIGYLTFALVYIMIYLGTARTYYKIVH